MTSLSGRLARWLTEFRNYKLDIQYKPGTEMVVADTLSRLDDHKLHTMSFDKAAEAYFKDGTLPKDKKLRKELQDHIPQLIYNSEDGLRHRDSPDGELVPYILLWG